MIGLLDDIGDILNSIGLMKNILTNIEAELKQIKSLHRLCLKTY